MSIVAAVTGITAVVNVCLGLLAAILLWLSPFATILLVFVAAATGSAYRGYAKLQQRYSSLQILYDFTRAVGASIRAEAVMHEVLHESRRLLRADTAEVLLVDRETGQPTFRQRNSDAEQIGRASCRERV